MKKVVQVIALVLPLFSCAGASNSNMHPPLRVSTSMEFFLNDLAVKGLDSRDRIRTSRLVLSPKLIKNENDMGVRIYIPGTIKEMQLDLWSALPGWYKSGLTRRAPSDECSTEDVMLDTEIVYWIAYNWISPDSWQIEPEDWEENGRKKREALIDAELVFQMLCDVEISR